MIADENISVRKSHSNHADRAAAAQPLSCGWSGHLVLVCVTMSHCIWPRRLALFDLLSVTTKSTARTMPKQKVYRMWDDYFRPKPNVYRRCSSPHVRRRNRNRKSVDLSSSTVWSHASCSYMSVYSLLRQKREIKQKKEHTDRQTDSLVHKTNLQYRPKN